MELFGSAWDVAFRSGILAGPCLCTLAGGCWTELASEPRLALFGGRALGGGLRTQCRNPLREMLSDSLFSSWLREIDVQAVLVNSEILIHGESTTRRYLAAACSNINSK